MFYYIKQKDFSDTKDEKLLHPDLIADITEAGIAKDRVQYWTSLKDFIDDAIVPQLNPDGGTCVIVKDLAVPLGITATRATIWMTGFPDTTFALSPSFTSR